jgi:uncharacterized protein YifN (PemK superfamily)
MGGELLKSSDIQVGHIYYVDYEPVRDGEFNGLHLSVVLKRNNDKHTFVVMPLTSSANGDGVNKVKIGKLTGLPLNIRSKDTYAVFNQVRTVNGNRFRALKSGKGRITVPMDSSTFESLYVLFMRDTLYNLDHDKKIAILKKAYDEERFNKAVDLAYTVIKLQRIGTNEGKITALKNDIKEIISDVSYSLDAKQTADGIQIVFNEVKNSSL